MDDTSFIDLEGHIIRTSPMKDEHQLIKITEKTVNLQNIGKIVLGDTYSNILTFEIKRYYDNVDLLTKDIRFIVKNDVDTFTENAVNIQYNDNNLRFSWVLSDAVTYKDGIVTAAIAFLGTESGRKYLLKTVPFTIKIENSLDFVECSAKYKNWFSEIECRVLELEKNGGSGSGNNDTDFATEETDKIDFSKEFEDILNGSNSDNDNIENNITENDDNIITEVEV